MRLFTVTYQHGDQAPRLHFESDTGSERFGVVDPIFGLLDRDVEARESFLRSQHEWFDMPRGCWEQKSRVIARLPDVVERIRQTHYLRRNSPSFIYRRLGERFANHDKITADDLKPPPVRRMVQYFGMSTDLSQPFLTKWRAAADSLILEIGFREAFERMSSLPVHLPPAFSIAYSALESDERLSWIADVQQRLCPVSLIHAVGLIVQNDMNQAKVVIDRLFASLSEAAYNCFETILRWSMQRIRARSGSDKFPEWAMFAAAWGHSVRIHSLVNKYSSNEKAQEFFSQFLSPVAGEAFETNDVIRGDVAHPNHLTRAALLLDGLSTVLKDKATPESELLSSVSNEIADICLHEANDRRIPKLYVLGDPMLHYNNLNSFLGQDRGFTFPVLLRSDDAEKFSSAHVMREVEALTSALLNDGKNEALWIILYALTGPKGFEGTASQNVQLLVGQTDFKIFANFESTARRLALLWLADQGRRRQRDVVGRQVKSGIMTLAKLFHRRSVLKTDAEDVVEALIETAHLFSTGAPTALEAVQQFAEVIALIQTNWPDASTPMYAILKSLLFRLPAPEAMELWNMAFKLRSSAK